jgi:uncharacterized protein
VIGGPAGECFVVDTVRGEGQAHGEHVFGGLSGIDPLRLSILLKDGSGSAIDIESTAFIDTETTGLGYGVGTHVFMIGVGHREGNAFRVRQFFMRHPGEEHAMLASLGEYLAQFGTVISFNGRAFDWPLLESRFIYRRMRLQPSAPVHLDLLFVARRLWKLRLESCGLSSIERSILGIGRTHDDVPGWLIPQLYFQYLRTGNANPLRGIFYHNLHDILSLAILTVHIDSLLADPWAGSIKHAIDFYSLGKLYEATGNADLAARCLRAALDEGLPRRTEMEALLRLAIVEKRRGDWDAARPLFDKVAAYRGLRRIACVELAKYYEHIVKEPERAMRYTMQALSLGDEPDYISWQGTRSIDLMHRRRRLLLRMGSDSAAIGTAR